VSNATFRALVTADTHLSNNLPHARPLPDGSGLTDRFHDQLALLEKMATVAKDEKVDAVFILGDLWDKRLLDAVTLRYSLEALAGFAPVPVYVLAGNHDIHSEVGLRSLTEVFEVTGWKHLHAVSRIEAWEPVKGISFWMLPYMPVEMAREHLGRFRGAIRKGATKAHFLLTHLPVLRADMGGHPSEIGLESHELTEGFNYVLAGHYHRAQDFPPSGTTGAGCYVGAPMHLSFADVGNPDDFYLYTFESSGSIQAEAEGSGTPRFHSVQWPATATGHELITAEGMDQVRAGDYLRAEVVATHADLVKMQDQIKQAVRALEERQIHFRAKHKPIFHHTARIASSGAGSSLNLEELLTQYVHSPEVEKGELNEERLAVLGRAFLANAIRLHGSRHELA